ncbi:MAG TPA: peroxiredoxin [Steroidobacteraceae bacterium]|nr:peroxiredoxin [Steroidobacteraceae bacterium]
MTVAAGKKSPTFSLPRSDGTVWKSTDAKGANLVLYFYPKDMTPGCTLEGQDFRELHPAFKRAGTMVLGISKDSCERHAKFRAREKFPFELLSDEDEKVCRLFDVIREKSLYGRKFMGIERSTFLIDANGVLVREWRKVRVKGHAAEVLEAARSL